MSKQISKYFIFTLLSFCLTFNLVSAETVDEINQQIDAKKKAIEELTAKMDAYQQNIRKKQEESASLSNQLSILENQIAKAELNLKATNEEISETQLTIRKVELEILTKEDLISKQKNNLANILQEIYKADQENAVKIFILNNSLSDYFNQVEYTKDLQSSLQDTVSSLKNEKQLLVTRKDELTKKQTELAELKKDLEFQRAEINGQVIYKNNLLVDTRQSEQKFNDLFWQAKQEQQAANNEIAALEKKMRSKLSQKPADKQLTDSTLSWPVPKSKITTYFNDQDYPFRYLFEHAAIDVKAAQGTALRAPADGYVLKAKDAGMGYSYISLIHANGISTVFGHVSAIYVRDDQYVAKGEVIGLSGGMPGTPGAGRLTTGPHLHFEVRLNGIPVNPLNYLP